MPISDVKVRCNKCGKDHPYRDDVVRMVCESCGTMLTLDNTKVILPPRDTKTADPLADF